jgi:hypothetical protein
MANMDQQTYSALRHGGASKARACTELGVSYGRGAELEQTFRRHRAHAPSEAMRPRFARHDRHVEAVLASGGYPVLR